MSKDNEKIRVGLSRFGDIVFDTLTRLLQEGDGQEGGEEFACSEQAVEAEDRRLPESTMDPQKGDGKWADEVRWKAA